MKLLTRSPNILLVGLLSLGLATGQGPVKTPNKESSTRRTDDVIAQDKRELITQQKRESSAGASIDTVASGSDGVVQSKDSIRVRFFDSVTGYAIDTQELANVALVGENKNQTRAHTERQGEVALAANAGETQISANIDGYKRLSTKIEHDVKYVEVLLEPVNPPAEMTEEAISKLVRPDTGTIIGYVIDDLSGAPLPDVLVQPVSNEAQVRTNGRGFFVLQVPVTTGDPEKQLTQVSISFSKGGFRTEEKLRVQVFPNNAVIYRVRLTPGTGVNKVDESPHRNRAATFPEGESAFPEDENEECEKCKLGQRDQEGASASILSGTAVAPATIRVGRNCTKTKCTSVTVLGLEDYVKKTLPAEWYPSWHINAQKAGAVAVRSYAAYFVNHPISEKYDICDNTYCQDFGDSTSSSTNSAVDQTTGTLLLDANGRIAKSEYSAENNNSGCGDGKTGACVSDLVCKGEAQFGHGRGMCQFGSQRWATGTDAKGRPNGYGAQDWLWILDHYYQYLNYRVVTPQKVAKPSISPGSQSSQSAVKASIATTTNGATIRYTTNGSDPTSTSTIYSSPLTFNSSVTLNAKAFKSGMTDSDVSSVIYSISIVQKVATPRISPSSQSSQGPVKASISTTTNGATIRYTTNGSDPTSSSTIYSGQLTLNSSVTLNARAFKNGMTNSDVASATYSIVQKVATPSISPSSQSSQSSVKASISTSTSGATIRYTTNGTDPTSSSAVYSSPLTFNSSVTLKAKAFKSGMTESNVASATYSISIVQKVATPSISPGSQSSQSPVKASISTTTSGATIRYTTTGSDPTSSSTIYSGPLTFNSSVTLKARAFKNGMTNSDVASATYSIVQKVATPSINPGSLSSKSPVKASISTTTSGATIRYTTNGADPTSSSAVYSSPLTFNSSVTLKARAFKNGITNSDVAKVTYSISKP